MYLIAFVVATGYVYLGPYSKCSTFTFFSTTMTTWWYGATVCRLFGFVARKLGGGPTDNACHVFAELDTEQPAEAVASFIMKVMLGHGRRRTWPHHSASLTYCVIDSGRTVTRLIWIVNDDLCEVDPLGQKESAEKRPLRVRLQVNMSWAKLDRLDRIDVSK